MKKWFYVFIAFAIASCSSGGTKINYEKTIADYVQTDKRGTKFDYKFKVIELDEHGTTTVADSIDFLSNEFKKEMEYFIKRFELAKDMKESLLTNEKKQSKVDEYRKDIALMEYRIDSLKNLTPNNLNGYESRNPNEILSRVVRCKYSVTLQNGINAEETFYFYLSPDGSECFGKNRVE